MSKNQKSIKKKPSYGVYKIVPLYLRRTVLRDKGWPKKNLMNVFFTVFLFTLIFKQKQLKTSGWSCLKGL